MALAHGERWVFTPEGSVEAGQVRIGRRAVLEDVAGNRVGRAFEVDEDTRPIDADSPAVRREFVVR